MGAHFELDITNGLPDTLHDALQEIMADDHVQWTMRMVPEDRVQEFRVRVVTKSNQNPVCARAVCAAVSYRDCYVDGVEAVTEVEPQP